MVLEVAFYFKACGFVVGGVRVAEEVLAEGRSVGMPCPSACREGARGPSAMVGRERAEVL